MGSTLAGARHCDYGLTDTGAPLFSNFSELIKNSETHFHAVINISFIDIALPLLLVQLRGLLSLNALYASLLK